MKQLIFILTLSIYTLTNTLAQSKYFHPRGIIDKTNELSRKNIWTSLNDKESVDGFTRIGDSIYGGEIDCNISPIKYIDIKSFKVLAGTKYAKDKNHVYYPLGVPCVDFTDCGVCYYDKIIIEKANPTTFKYLSKDYATDGKYIFFRGQLLQGADALTFKVIDGPQFFYFATDKNNVYIHDDIFKEAEQSTFYYAKDDPRNKVSDFENVYIIADKNNKWKYIPPNQIIRIDK